MAIIRGHCWLTRLAMGKRAAAFPPMGRLAACQRPHGRRRGRPARCAASPLVAATTLVIPGAGSVFGLADRHGVAHRPPVRLVLVVGGARQRRGRLVFVVLGRGIPRGKDGGARQPAIEVDILAAAGAEGRVRLRRRLAADGARPDRLQSDDVVGGHGGLGARWE
jgi:hypothetical protein